ncbi:MAG: metalloregulator ArsR/SmtB family transcription factor [Acetobacteraceae bacterium]
MKKVVLAHSPPELHALEVKAGETARLLRLLANGRRLALLCHLIEEGEATVGRLAEAVGLSQPALSQHLAKLRREGLVVARREATALHYRLADPRVARLLVTLRDLFCSAPSTAKDRTP